MVYENYFLYSEIQMGKENIKVSIKKRIGTFLLMMMMCMSSTPAFAANNISMGDFKGNLLNNTSTPGFPLKTVDGQEVHIPDIGKVEEINKKIDKKVKSFSKDDYAQTKAVADQKASILTYGYGCTSVQYALIDNGKIVLSGNSGVYSKEDNKAVTADNMYGIASISKMFVTTAVMKLVDKGIINLDDPVTKHIRDFKMADDRYKKITVRMLLNHSSGLMGSSFSNAILFGDNDSYAHDTLLKQLET